MGKIALARVDDRLIHGQVMTAWVGHVGANEILIVDDAVAKDDFLSMVITAAAPKNLKATAVTVDFAVDRLSNGFEEGEDGAKLILLAKEPSTFLEMVKRGVPIKEVDLGGMGSTPNRTRLYRNISASEEDRAALRELQASGIEVYIQVVPNSERVELSKVL